MQPNKFADKILQEELNQEDPADKGNEMFREFDFVENKKLLDIVNVENIGSLECFLQSETGPRRSSSGGKRMREATAGHEGQFVVPVTTRNAEGVQLYDDHDCLSSSEFGCETRVPVQDKDDVKEMAKNCVAPVKVEDHDNGCPSARKFIHVLTFGEEGSCDGQFHYPWGVAVNERDEIAVTDVHNERVQVFSSDGSHLRSFGREGKKPEEFLYPAGIDFDKNGNITVVDSEKREVKIFNENGDFLRQFDGNGSLNRPLGLSLESNGNIILADSDNKLIKIFSPAGEFLGKIGGKGTFASPYHCVQYDKYLIVSDRDKHRIKVFERERNFLYEFGKKGNKDGEFNKPHCLSINKEGQLFICDTMNHRVQVFKFSEKGEKFLTKFGTKGKGKGEFDRPISTAVLSNGRIVVTDFGNHRIHMFEYR